ncbi:MAG: PorV/PorQ family protein [Ignavibacteriales bacterium]|nr:PorV/PorQ family protein [Ignavibacteriales bacterium]
MKIRIILLVELVFLVCMRNGSIAQDNVKLAQTGFDFLSVISDAKAAGMAGAVNTLPMGSGSLFFNPACLTDMKNAAEISASYNPWIADIKHTQFSAAVNLGSWGVVGVSLQNVNYGDFYKTIVTNEGDNFLYLGTFSLQANSFGIGYANKLTDQFSVGGQIKYVQQSLGDGVVPTTIDVRDSTTVTTSFKLNPIAFDFGTLFKTGLKSLAFGISIRHFSGQLTYQQESFQMPLLFTLGVSMDIMDFWEKIREDHSLVVSVDLTHDRSYPEQLLVGINYTFLNTISLRGGYNSHADLEKFSYGVGVSQFGLSIDYAYTPLNYFDNLQRITVRLKI